MHTVTGHDPRPWSPGHLPTHFRRQLASVAAVAYVTGLLVRVTTRGFDPWVGYELLVGYASHGFVRRGLVGTFVEVWVQSAEGAFAVAVALSAVSALATWFMLRVVCARIMAPEQRNVVVAACVPLFSQIGWDLGRQDMLLLPLLIGVVVLVRTGRVHWVTPLLLGGLVHEHFLSWVMVILFAGLVLGWTDISRAAAPATVGVALGLLLAVFGSFEGSADAFEAALPAWAPTTSGGWLVPRWAAWIGSPVDAVGHVRSYLGIGGWIATAMLVAALAACMATLARRLDVRISIAVALPSVALAAVGTDHMRWALWLVVVTGLLLAAERALPPLRGDRLVPTLVVLLVLGPPGYLAPFPYWTAS